MSKNKNMNLYIHNLKSFMQCRLCYGSDLTICDFFGIYKRLYGIKTPFFFLFQRIYVFSKKSSNMNAINTMDNDLES